jgi:hypothetical protein
MELKTCYEKPRAVECARFDGDFKAWNIWNAENGSAWPFIQKVDDGKDQWLTYQSDRGPQRITEGESGWFVKQFQRMDYAEFMTHDRFDEWYAFDAETLLSRAKAGAVV